MTAGNIALVHSSWQQVQPIKDTAGQLFYGRLVEAWADAYDALASAVKHATTAAV